MFKSLTGPMMLVFKDPGSLTAVSMYRKIGCKQTCQWIRVKQALKFPCLLHVLYFWLSDRWPNNCLINYLCYVGNVPHVIYYLRSHSSIMYLSTCYSVK